MTMLAQNTFTVKRATKDGYSCSLNSYSVMLNADSNGVINGLAAASTTVKLYQGSTAVTPVISIDSTSNCSVGISGLNVSIVSVPNNTKSGYVDIKIVYGSFVKIERYTFTVVDYTIVKNYTQTIVGDQMTSYATKNAVDILGQTVSNQSTTIQQNSKDIALKASNKAVSDLGDRMTLAEASIKPDAIRLTVAQQTANIASYMRGKMLYRDPTFSSGNNGTNVYNNSGGGTVTVVRTSGISGNPNNSGYCLKIDNTGTASPGLGGFYFGTQTRAGAILVTRIIANIPIGYSINWASNTYGSGGSLKWLTSQLGTGTWTEYVCVVTCGTSGTFSSTNFFYLTGSGTVSWYVAYATVFDTTEVDATPTTDEIKASFTIDTGGISMLGKKISLVGMVTFSSLALDAQNKISTAQSTADKAQDTADAKASTSYVDDAKGAAISAAASDATGKVNTALSSAKGYTDSLKGSLKALAWEDTVGLAKLDNTIIDGGFIKTTLIRADEIFVKGLQAIGVSAKTIDAGNATIKNLNVDTVKMTNADVSGKITAASGAIGLFSIDNNGLYFGDPTKWRTSAYKQDLASIVPGCIKIQKQIGYFQPGDIANIKVGIGDGADPSVNPTGSSFCTSAGYFYRQMNSSTDPYFPAVRIISDNVVNRNIALETIGGIRAKNGMIDMGRLMRVNDMNAVNVIDLSFGTSIVISNSMNNFSFFLPTLSQVRAQLGITSSDSFCIPLRIGIDKNSYYGIYLKTQNKANPPASDAEGGMLVDNDGREWQSSNLTMAKGDVARFSLTYTPYSGYYAQLDTWFN